MSLFVPDGVYPEGGWTLADPPLHAANLDELSEKLAAYRLRAGLPVGDPRADCLAAICARNPSRCRESDPSGTHPVARDGSREVYPRQLQPLVLSWLASELQVSAGPGRRAHVSPEETRRRASICLRCPAHLDTLTGCPNCQGGIRTARGILVPKPAVDLETLGGCAAYRADVAVLAHLAYDPRPPEDPGLARSPECWRKAA